VVAAFFKNCYQSGGGHALLFQVVNFSAVRQTTSAFSICALFLQKSSVCELFLCIKQRMSLLCPGAFTLKIAVLHK